MGLVGNYPGVPFFDIRGIRVLVFARPVLLFTIKKRILCWMCQLLSTNGSHFGEFPFVFTVRKFRES